MHALMAGGLSLLVLAAFQMAAWSGKQAVRAVDHVPRQPKSSEAVLVCVSDVQGHPGVMLRAARKQPCLRC